MTALLLATGIALAFAAIFGVMLVWVLNLLEDWRDQW